MGVHLALRGQTREDAPVVTDLILHNRVNRMGQSRFRLWGYELPASFLLILLELYQSQEEHDVLMRLREIKTKCRNELVRRYTDCNAYVCHWARRRLICCVSRRRLSEFVVSKRS